MHLAPQYGANAKVPFTTNDRINTPKSVYEYQKHAMNCLLTFITICMVLIVLD